MIEGLIVAKRHLHLDVDTAEKLNVNDNDIVKIKLTEDERSLIFDDVVVRVGKNYRPAVHLDTVEGNAANIIGNVSGLILK